MTIETADVRRWISEPVPEPSENLGDAGVPTRLVPLLVRRGVRNVGEAERFLAPSTDDLHPPHALAGMLEAVDALDALRRRGGSVTVVGDYDVDGITASALVIATLEACGVEVDAILPHRLREGYGLQPVHIETARARGADVVVSLDCGIAAHEAIRMAIDAGLRMIVVDHHLPQEPLPREAIVVDPKREECHYPFTELSAAGLALKLCVALARRWERDLSIEGMLRLAALGTVADMVPLVGENRVIARLGLEALGETSSLGLRELFRRLGLTPPIRAEDVGFRLGPRLNAAGRLGSAHLVLDLLMTRDAGRARRLAAELEALNERRRQEQERVVEEACDRLDRRTEIPPFIVEWSDTWHRGVVGIAASRLARRFERPVLLLSVEGELATGSGRSVEGISLHEFLEPWRQDMERFGGHQQAVGVTVRRDRLEPLRAAWEAAAGAWPLAIGEIVHRYELEVEPAALDRSFVGELQRLEPHGIGNPKPVLKVGPWRLAGAPRRFGHGHLGASAVAADGTRVDLVGWRWATREQELEGSFEILARVGVNDYTGRVELELVDVRAASSHA